MNASKKDKMWNNYIPYNNCCGGYTNAVGTKIEIDEPDLGAKAKKLLIGIVALVGVVVTSTYVYNRWIKK